MKSSLILMISKRMDSNRKRGRHEDQLIRLSKKAREALGLDHEDTVELWPDGSIHNRIHRNKVLKIFKAYSKDLNEARKKVSEEDFYRIGFVTTRTFNIICGPGKEGEQASIWISDTVEDIIVGADPEFLLVTNDGRVQYAAEVEGLDYNDVLGSDGPLAEIRPDPEITVDIFVNNIRDILTNHRNTELIKEFQWLGGCYYLKDTIGRGNKELPIGGHIHIGTPAKLAAKIANKEINESLVFSCLAKILDEYLAIPLIRLDGKENSIKRRQQYGYYGDFRTDNGRLEYRALSGEWLTHPVIASKILGVAKALAHEYFKILDESNYDPSLVVYDDDCDNHNIYYYDVYNDDFDSWKQIEIIKVFDAHLKTSRVRKILNNGTIRFTKGFFNKLKTGLTSISVYNQYAEYIDPFLQLVQMPAKDLLERDKDLKHTWVEGQEFIIK